MKILVTMCSDYRLGINNIVSLFIWQLEPKEWYKMTFASLDNSSEISYENVNKTNMFYRAINRRDKDSISKLMLVGLNHKLSVVLVCNLSSKRRIAYTKYNITKYILSRNRCIPRKQLLWWKMFSTLLWKDILLL